jgi:POT family proton-dependent oligopeptide transporter
MDTQNQTSKHPAGLPVLFFTELWERFSYYGMRAILVLFMVTPEEQGGLGFATAAATSLYGTYTMSVYFTGLPGGFIADRWLGARLAVLIGGIIIACGHFTMIFHSLPFFYAGLVLISIGTGLLKPNISTMVGSLYEKSDPRRDSGFSIFYMGINVGAVLAPLVCGYFAQSDQFKQFLVSVGIDPMASWHWGFGAAGVGMILGLVVYLLLGKRLHNVGNRVPRAAKVTSTEQHSPLSKEEWKRVWVIIIFFAFTALFWSAYEQKGASLNLFALKLVDTQLFGWAFPSSWLQSLTAFFVIGLAPIFSKLWITMGDRQPSSPAKFAFGLLFIGLAYTLFVPACALTAEGKISPLWLVGLYFLEVTGEMCLSPVGLSTVTKLAPAKLLGIMMGVWFLASAIGNKLAGFFGGFFIAEDHQRLMTMYGSIAAGLLIASAILALLTPKIKQMMGGVR